MGELACGSASGSMGRRAGRVRVVGRMSGRAGDLVRWGGVAGRYAGGRVGGRAACGLAGGQSITDLTEGYLNMSKQELKFLNSARQNR